MSIQQAEEPDREQEKQVVRYLREHPDFFERHRELLGDMVLPHEAGGAVSLIERQVGVLREQKDELRRRLQRLVDNARLNEELVERIHALVLALLDARDLETVLDTVRERLLSDFEADAVVLRLFRPADARLAGRPEFVDWSEPVLGAFEKVIRGGRPVCGRLKSGQLDSLFADEAGAIASAALVPLRLPERERPLGLLAIGSRRRDRFHAEMGTLFLAHLGDVIARVLRPHLRE